MRTPSKRKINQWLRENPQWVQRLDGMTIADRIIIISYAICKCNAAKAALFTGLNYQTFYKRLLKAKQQVKRI